MRLMLLVVAATALAVPAMSADLLQGVTQKVDDTASAANGRTDTGAQKADSAVTNALGKGVLSDAASTRIGAKAGAAKAKTNTGAAKVKSVVDKAAGKKQAAKDLAVESVNKAVQ